MKIKNKYYLIGFFLIGFLFLSFNCGFIIASGDDDNDGIDDNFEEINKRDIEMEITENEAQIKSIRRSDIKKDEIEFNIGYNEGGISIEIRYRSKIESNLEPEFELEFGILFRGIIEYIDLNDNDIYDHEVDQFIGDYEINIFQPLVYTTYNISNNSTLHHILINSTDGVFATHMYFTEEFVVVNDTLITPTQVKIDVEISNYDYINESSRLALFTMLNSEVCFKEEEGTEDENKSYATNETGITTTINNYTGYFTWKEKAIIDEIPTKISVSGIGVDDCKENEQKLYINYPSGDFIFHETKLGIEGLLISITESDYPLNLFILIFIIGAISASVAYSVYYYGKHKFPTKTNHKYREEDFIEPYNGKLALQILEGENAIEKLYLIKDINITSLTEDFIEIINRFDWDRNEKGLFIREMLSLSPFERELMLRDMLKSSK